VRFVQSNAPHVQFLCIFCAADAEDTASLTLNNTVRMLAHVESCLWRSSHCALLATDASNSPYLESIQHPRIGDAKN
jgi:hypothetical protein